MTAVLEAAVHAYEPVGAARELFRAREPEILLSGPVRTGKSRACLEKIFRCAWKYPGMKALVVRKFMSTLAGTALDTWQNEVAREALENGAVIWFGGNAQTPQQYRFSNGSVMNVGGMDKASKIMSSEYDVIFVQEAQELSQTDWQALVTRLSGKGMPYRQLIADTNPSYPTHWLKQRCDRGITRMIDCKHSDNPRFYRNGAWTAEGREYMAKLDALTGVDRLRWRDGLWVAAEGVIYREFDRAVHLVDAMPDGWETWTRWWSVDFGFVNPFVIQMWAEDGDGRLWLYRELYQTGRTAEQMATAALDLVAPENEDGVREWREPKPRDVITDHSPEYRTQFEKTLGRSTTKAQKEVTPGIQAVQKRLTDRRLFMLRDALTNRDPDLDEKALPCSTIEEIAGYVWADSKQKDQPVKQNDHGMDALRYIVAERDFGGRPGMRFMSI